MKKRHMNILVKNIENSKSMNRRHEGNVLLIARQLDDFHLRVGLIPNFGPPKVIRSLNGISCEHSCRRSKNRN